MNVWYILFVILINLVIVVFWRIYKKKRAYDTAKLVPEIHDFMKEGEYEKALSMLKKIEKQVPPVAYEMMGECYFKMGDKGKAYGFYEKSLSVDNTMGFAYIGLAEIDMDEGDYIKAERSLKKALENDDDNFIAMYYLAHIYSSWGRNAEAASLLERAIAKGLIIHDAYLMLLDYYESIGEYAAAKNISEKLEHLKNNRTQ
jgi:tetratricopeptide (TPR) repeat protein